MGKSLAISPTFDSRLQFCPLCDSENIRYCDRDYTGITIDKCQNCGVRFMNPQYSDAYQDSLYDGYIPTDEITSLDGIWEDAHKQSHHFHFQKIEEVSAPGKLLAFGCGNGKEIEVGLERNWEVEGFDVDQECVNELIKTHSIPVHTGDFFKLGLPDESYDCIYLDQVLEHLKNPAPYLKEFHRLLKTEGVLFLAVPNIESLASRWKTLLGKLRLKRHRGKHYDTWHHLFYFSPRSLGGILEKRFGFESVARGNDVFLVPGLSWWRKLMVKQFKNSTLTWRSTCYVLGKKRAL